MKINSKIITCFSLIIALGACDANESIFSSGRKPSPSMSGMGPMGGMGGNSPRRNVNYELQANMNNPANMPNNLGNPSMQGYDNPSMALRSISGNNPTMQNYNVSMNPWAGMPPPTGGQSQAMMGGQMPSPQMNMGMGMQQPSPMMGGGVMPAGMMPQQPQFGAQMGGMQSPSMPTMGMQQQMPMGGMNTTQQMPAFGGGINSGMGNSMPPQIQMPNMSGNITMPSMPTMNGGQTGLPPQQPQIGGTGSISGMPASMQDPMLGGSSNMKFMPPSISVNAPAPNFNTNTGGYNSNPGLMRPGMPAGSLQMDNMSPDLPIKFDKNGYPVQ